MDDPHQIYIDQLMLLADEREDPAVTADLRQHVGQCSDCQKDLEGLRRLGRMLDEALTAHPEVDELVGWATDPQSVGGRGGDIARHVAECPMCEAHVEMLREESGRSTPEAAAETIPPALLAQLKGPTPIRRRFRPHVWGAWVALAAGLMITVGVNTLNHTPAPQQPTAIGMAPTAAQTPAGVVDRDFVPPPPAALQPALDMAAKKPEAQAETRTAPANDKALQPQRETFQYNFADRKDEKPAAGQVAPANPLPPDDDMESQDKGRARIWSDLLTRRGVAFEVSPRHDGVVLKVRGHLTPQEREEATRALMAQYGLARPSQVEIIESAAAAGRRPAQQQ